MENLRDCADFVGSKKHIRDFLSTLDDWSLEHDIVVIQLSTRIYAVFQNEKTFLVPDSELPETGAQWLKNN